MKDVFDINELDLAKICKAFGFSKPPFTNLNIRPPTSNMRRKKDQTNKEKFYNSNKDKNKSTQYTY
jgi:hypothetical protein